MEKEKETIDLLAEDLAKELADARAIVVGASEGFVSLGDPSEYTRATNDYSCASLMVFHLSLLETFVKARDAQRAENVVRLTLYQLERTENPTILELDWEWQEDDSLLMKMMVTKAKMHRTFKRFLDYFEETHRQKSTNQQEALRV